MDEDWILIRRGPAPLDRTFSLGDLFEDHFGLLDPIFRTAPPER